MREVVFDTETTGLSPDLGHRIVELGAVEIVDGAVGRNLQCYFNPERASDAGAYEVHGLSDEFLAGQPTFAEQLADILKFFGDAQLIAHNADFDRGFLNHELRLADYPPLPEQRFIDTLKMSQRRYKSGRHSLNALCKRLDIDHSQRGLHSALEDAQLLAQVYLKMIVAGEQHSMSFETRAATTKTPSAATEGWTAQGFATRQVAPWVTDAATLEAHRAFLERDIPKALWLDDTPLATEVKN